MMNVQILSLINVGKKGVLSKTSNQHSKSSCWYMWQRLKKFNNLDMSSSSFLVHSTSWFIFSMQHVESSNVGSVKYCFNQSFFNHYPSRTLKAISACLRPCSVSHMGSCVMRYEAKYLFKNVFKSNHGKPRLSICFWSACFNEAPVCMHIESQSKAKSQCNLISKLCPRPSTSPVKLTMSHCKQKCPLTYTHEPILASSWGTSFATANCFQ